jgi:aspartate carbamoyltransferase catalytic subunit
MPAKLSHILESQQFHRQWLEQELFPLARQMEFVAGSGGANFLRGKRMFYLFYEPSTRTRVSFESAMQILGGHANGTENAREFSSVTKGETLEDTIRILNAYLYDVVVIRYHEEGGAARAAAASTAPVINAGDGAGQHPTQALLDVYTIKERLGDVGGLRVAMVGDLSYGRTVHSLTYLLAKYPGVELFFVSPASLRMKQGIKDYLERHDVPFQEVTSLTDIVGKVDVVYLTRAQTERFAAGERQEDVRGAYSMTTEMMARLQAHAIVMHPLPRREELPVELDGDGRLMIFRQAQNGLFVRMALLHMLLA